MAMSGGAAQCKEPLQESLLETNAGSNLMQAKNHRLESSLKEMKFEIR